MKVQLPFGRSYLQATVPDDLAVDLIAPPSVPASADPQESVARALDAPLGGCRLEDFAATDSIAIAINDKTRPVPHQHLLPPLLQRLEAMGIPAQAITLCIATGSHPPMTIDEYPMILPEAIYSRYKVISHDSSQVSDLILRGKTQRGTPVWVNRGYAEAGLRLVVGNIEPHQFAGFSGGVKTAAIGLAGPLTINHNHAMMMDPEARLGDYETNPVRQDIEQMGELIGVHFALNAVLNHKKQIVHVVAGEPRAVMAAGVPLARQVCQVQVPGLYDLILTSPGGYPKDINLYQAQKALGHAALVARPGGMVILVAACPEGTGSEHYESWVKQRHSLQEVFTDFKKEGFRIGPHKAYQIARDATKVRLLFCTEMPDDMVRQLLLTPVNSLQAGLDIALKDLKPGARVGIIPNANSTIPFIGE